MLLPGQAFPVLCNLQEHLEAPQQYSRHINLVLKQHFNSSHSPMLLALIKCTYLHFYWIDNCTIACDTITLKILFCEKLDTHLSSIPITRHGTMTHFKGINIL